MNVNTAVHYNNFRTLCLSNAEAALSAAESLVGKKANHIAYHLTVLCLEEIGKIFLGWCLLNQKDEWGKEKLNIPLDDHVKKLFWAIWGPTFMSQIIDKGQMDKIKGLATILHEKRLNVLYTNLNDTVPAASKVDDNELLDYLSWTKARLHLAQEEGDLNSSVDSAQQEDMLWFSKISDDPVRRGFIFSEESQQKLINCGNVTEWIKWLKERFQDEQDELKKILDRELGKSASNNPKKPKWKVRFRLTSSSHSIRANVLNSFNEKSELIKLSRGDVNTLIVDLILGDDVSIKSLWHHGWLIAKTFVGALNIGTNGFIYWNITVDTDKYYEKIWDLENNKQIVAALATDLRLDWKSRQLFLSEQELSITSLVFGYFIRNIATGKFEAVDAYLIGLAMLAKTDLHFRFESQCFYQFYVSLKKAIILNEKIGGDFDIKVEGFKQLGKVLIDRTAFDSVMDLGISMSEGKPLSRQVTLTDVIAIKQYSGHYFVTLALRQFHKDENVALVLLNDKEENKK